MAGTHKLGTVCPASYPLWSGRRAALVNPRHCDLPLLNGYFPYRPPRGTCEVRGASPNLWLAVVPALGFRSQSARQCWIESPRRQWGPALLWQNRSRWRRWCASRPTLSVGGAGRGLGRSINGGFSLHQTSPPRSSFPRWAVLRVWGFVRSLGQSLPPSGTFRFSSRIVCLGHRTWSYCEGFAYRLPRRFCSWAPTRF